MIRPTTQVKKNAVLQLEKQVKDWQQKLEMVKQEILKHPCELNDLMQKAIEGHIEFTTSIIERNKKYIKEEEIN